MNRQEAFEKAYAEAHDLPLETFAQYRMGETYRLPGIAKCWRFWNLALDSFAGSQKLTTITKSFNNCLICGEHGGHNGLGCPKFQAESVTIQGVPYK